MHQWFIYQNHDQASKAAAKYLADSILSVIKKQNVCHVVLPGGNTPIDCLRYLAEKPLAWNKVHWYPGDERCQPRGHTERNDRMLQEVLWSRLEETNIHVIPAEMGAEAAATHFCDEISGIEHFDIAFVGLGEDGHTASLFPGNAALQDKRKVVPVHNSPKPPDDRVSLSLAMLAKTPCKVVLATGVGKAKIIARIKKGEELPVNCLGDIDWFLDEDANTVK